MTLWDGYDGVAFQVVRNAEDQYAVWPAERVLPPGWERVGGPASKDECLDDVERRWTDLRPLSVREGRSRPLAPTPAPGTARRGGGSAVQGPVEARPETPAHVLIEQADLPLSRIALRCGPDTMSRGELLDTARQWAAALATEGCGPETPVALLLPRGVDAIVAILAVLRAGSAYVPLSCDDPAERLLAVLDDCGRPLVLAAEDVVDRLPGYQGRVLTVSELRARGRVSRPAAPATVTMDDLAFVFYTSGTTGRPKGVEGTHRQLVNYAYWCRSAFAHAPDEWTVLHASLSFLGSLTTIVTPLLAGWPIEIAPEGSTIDDLLAIADRAPIGLLKLTPTHLRMLRARGAAGREIARRLMIGSEPLVMSPELLAWIESEPATAFANHYGLTETHGCFCHWFREEVPVGATVPIGAPISNVRAHVVDRHGDDVEIGEVGELLVAGESIARGYRGRARLTAERWVPYEHGAPGERALRTGDLARLRPDGDVEIVGRADRQVKVRGHRVEPGAVEDALRARPDVLEALVLPRVADGGTTLVAYVVPRASTDLDATALHRELASRLPAPAVPSRFAFVPEFPTNRNGKIDVSALPEPSPMTPVGEGAAPVATATSYDAVVAEEFAAALDLDAVGRDDDFFALGGDSLLGVHVAVRIGERLGAEVPVPTAGHGSVGAYARIVADLLGGRPVESMEDA